MYRQGELVLGPVLGAQLLERLYAGDINGQTEVAQVGHDFERITQVDSLRVHLAKAEAKRRVDALERRVSDRRAACATPGWQRWARWPWWSPGWPAPWPGTWPCTGRSIRCVRRQASPWSLPPSAWPRPGGRRTSCSTIRSTAAPGARGAPGPAPPASFPRGTGDRRRAADPDDVSVEAKFDRGIDPERHRPAAARSLSLLQRTRRAAPRA